MDKHMETLLVMFYEKSYGYFADLRKGTDMASLNYSKGHMDALQAVVHITGWDMNLSNIAYAVTAIIDAAEHDAASGDWKGRDEIADIASKAMKAAA